MKNNWIRILFSIAIACLFIACNSSTDHTDVSQTGFADSTMTEPWSAEQLMEPSELATLLDDSSKILYIYNIGPAGAIKNSVKIGATKEQANLDLFKEELEPVSRDASVVIYCGCCPFKDCPNIRPAFELLNEMGFTNHKLLNLEKNLKTNWIDPGYPMAE